MNFKINDIIRVKVINIAPYGVFVSAPDDYKGLIHISEITGKYVNNISKYFKINKETYARIIGIDNKNKHLKLSTINLHESKKLQETGEGFKELESKLPEWIDLAKKEIENDK